MEKQVFDFKRGKSININYQFITDQKDDYFNKKSQNCYEQTDTKKFFIS